MKNKLDGGTGAANAPRSSWLAPASIGKSATALIPNAPASEAGGLGVHWEPQT